MYQDSRQNSCPTRNFQYVGRRHGHFHQQQRRDDDTDAWHGARHTQQHPLARGAIHHIQFHLAGQRRQHLEIGRFARNFLVTDANDYFKLNKL